MKGTSLVVNIVLFVAVAILYVLHFTGECKNENGSSADSDTVVNRGGLKIAYVKADSVLLNYDLSQDLHDDFTKKQDAYTTEYGTKRQAFEKDAAAFQEKLKRGGFLTEQRAVQERDRLLGIEQEVKKMDQELSTKLGELQNENNKQILDKLLEHLKELNVDKKYDYIFSASNILIGDEADNLTAEVLKALNKKYTKEPKK